jgi:TonB family protein
MHPAAAQSLLAPRPSKVVPFFALSIGLHVLAIAIGLVASWLIAPAIVNLDQKPITASLVRLGKPRDEKLLPRKEEAPPEQKKEEKIEVPLPMPSPKAVVVPGPEAKKPTAKQDLFKALANASKQAKPEELEGKADGDPNGDSAKQEGERYYGIISAAVRRYYDVSNTIPEAERRTLKAQVAFKVSGSGEAMDVHLTKGSGNELFDEAVVSAVKKAAPFSPPPEHMKKLLLAGVTLSFTP